jgi:acyl carrier protein
MNEREARVKAILCEMLGRGSGELLAATSLRDELGVDSTEMVEIVCALEKAFGLHLAPDSDKQLRTVGDLCAAVAT